MQRLAMINNLGWGSLRESPILSAIGTNNTAAIVCEILLVQPRSLKVTYKVAITSAIKEKMMRILYNPKPSTRRSRRPSRSSRRPDERVAFPSAIPPMARKTIDQ